MRSWGSSVSIPTEVQTGQTGSDWWQGHGFICHCIQTNSGAHPASYSVGTRALTLGIKQLGH